jgi:hypothetical protein
MNFKRKAVSYKPTVIRTVISGSIGYAVLNSVHASRFKIMTVRFETLLSIYYMGRVSFYAPTLFADRE